MDTLPATKHYFLISLKKENQRLGRRGGMALFGFMEAESQGTGKRRGRTLFVLSPARLSFPCFLSRYVHDGLQPWVRDI